MHRPGSLRDVAARGGEGRARYTRRVRVRLAVVGVGASIAATAVLVGCIGDGASCDRQSPQTVQNTVAVDAGPDAAWLADIGPERCAALCGYAVPCRALDGGGSIGCDLTENSCK